DENWIGGSDTKSFTPSKLNACPTFPAAKVAPLTSVPLWPPLMSLALPSPGHQDTIFGGGTVHVWPTASVVKLSITPSKTSNQRRMAPLSNTLTTVCLHFMSFSFDKVWLETYAYPANVSCSSLPRREVAAPPHLVKKDEKNLSSRPCDRKKS